MDRAVNSAARSADSTAHVLGIASASTKNTMTLSTKPMATPAGPNRLSATSVVRNAWPICSTVTVTSSGLMKRSGWLTRRCSDCAAFEPCESAIACALTREMRLSAVSATARKPRTNRIRKIAISIPRFGAGHRVLVRVVLLAEPGRRRAAPVVSARAARARGRRIARGLVRLGVVVAEHVEHAVHDEERELVVERAGVVGRLLAGDVRADHDVAEQHRHVACRQRSSSSSVVERERQHVGRAVLAHVLGVQGGDLVAVDERQRQLAAAALLDGARPTPAGTSGRRRRRPCTRLLLVGTDDHRRPIRYRRWDSEARSLRSPATPPRCALIAPSTGGLGVALVRGDDVGDDPVAHHVGGAELDEGQPVDALQDPLEADAGRSCRWGRRSG